MKNTKLLKILLTVAEQLGTVKSAHAYENGFICVEGTLAEGAPFSLNFSVQERSHG